MAVISELVPERRTASGFHHFQLRFPAPEANTGTNPKNTHTNSLRLFFSSTPQHLAAILRAHRLPTVGGFTFALVRWGLLRWLPTLGLIIPSISVLFYAFFFSPIAICIFEENCRVHSWGKLFVCRKNEKTLIGELIEAAQQCLCSKVEGSF